MSQPRGSIVEEADVSSSGGDGSGCAHVPISTPAEAELARIATNTSIRLSIARRGTDASQLSDPEGRLSRGSTLAGISPDSPELDPANDKFDLYKWLSFFLRSMDEEKLKVHKAGILFRNLDVFGSGFALNLQKNVGSIFMAPFRLNEYFGLGRKNEKRILKGFDGLINSGELLIVLGRPGSGCSTLLKAICGGELHGLSLDPKFELDYDGIPLKQMLEEFKGDLIYNQEEDKHFPHLTVGQTLEMAAAYRTPSSLVQGLTREGFVKVASKVIMAIFGLSQT